MNAFRDDADGGAVQPHEVSHLSEPILVNVNSTVNLLVGKESQKSSGSDLYSWCFAGRGEFWGRIR